MRILLIEDDQMIGEAVSIALRDAAYAVDWVKNWTTANDVLKHGDHQTVLLDLGLPKRDGLEVLRRLRQGGSAVPVIIITARDGVEDRIRGLDLGADDYLVKPFDVNELLARLRAVVRRQGGQAAPLLSKIRQAPSFTDWCDHQGITPRFGAVDQHRSIALKVRFILTLKNECMRILLAPLRADTFHQELRCFANWYNQSRPHSSLHGKSPHEAYHDSLPACERPIRTTREMAALCILRIAARASRRPLWHSFSPLCALSLGPEAPADR